MTPGSGTSGTEGTGSRARRRRRRPSGYLRLERELWARGLERVAGVDEAGRGPLAGPVFAAAVILLPGKLIRGVDDSKLLTGQRRERLAVRIRERAVAWALGAASTREVDRLNILRASHLAMRRALARLRAEPQHVVVDGLPVRDLWPKCECTAVVDGDQLCHAVACASILAKVYRDRVMRRLAGRYPGYGWDTNVGYGTAEHREAIGRLGVTPHHRLTFAPLQLTLELGDDGPATSAAELDDPGLDAPAGSDAVLPEPR
ncbi:MAG TPA: ribonuclease HII [Longimicrobiales bacterium]|nr:ribonuclease HII [Longimicrobiales bacterium]